MRKEESKMANYFDESVYFVAPPALTREYSPPSSSNFTDSNAPGTPQSYLSPFPSPISVLSPTGQAPSISPINTDDMTQNLSESMPSDLGPNYFKPQVQNFQASGVAVGWESASPSSSSTIGSSEYSRSPPSIMREPAPHIESFKNAAPSKPESRIPPCAVCNSNYRVRGTYGAMVCDMCQHFFRQMTQFKRYTTLECKSGLFNCPLISWEKRKCPACRYRKCIDVGLKKELVLDEAERRRKNRSLKMVDKEKSPIDGSNDDYQSIQQKFECALQPFGFKSNQAGCSSNDDFQLVPRYNQNVTEKIEEPLLSLASIPFGITIGWINELNSMERQLLKELYGCNILYNGRSSDIPSSLVGRDPRDPLYQEELSEFCARKAAYGIVRGAKRLSGFRELDEDDKVALIKVRSKFFDLSFVIVIVMRPFSLIIRTPLWSS